MTVELNWILYLVFAAFVIVGCVNAVNLTDGIDGQSSSVTFVVMIFFTAAAAKWELMPLALFPAALAGGLCASILACLASASILVSSSQSSII